MSTNAPTRRENGLDPEGRYEVRKHDDPTGKHDECAYFVLDPQHDPGARFALRAYKVWASRNGYEVLAEDLDRWLSEIDGLPGLVSTDRPTPAFECRVCDYTSDEAGDTHTHPTPERVALSAEEREAVVAVNHCTPDGKIMEALVPVIERIIAAREQALREEIAGEVEAALIAPLDHADAGYNDGVRTAARIARGGVR